jgi:hypothetical protein
MNNVKKKKIIVIFVMVLPRFNLKQGWFSRGLFTIKDRLKIHGQKN